jgi:large subunit ribosomal protein L32e
MAKEDVVKHYTALKGVGKAKAELLYDTGFTSMTKLAKATMDDLTKIKGISEQNARDILTQIQEKPAGKPQPAKAAKKPKAEETPAKPEEPETTPEEEPEVVEEEEPKYRVKKKPELTPEQRHTLQVRRQIKQRTPTFLREEWFRYKRIPKNWRRPDGITSKMRINLKYRPNKVRVGFRGPRDTRGLHSSGFQEVLVHTVQDLEQVNPKTQAVRIGSTVGTKKRLEISKRADELDVRILNWRS